MSKKKRCGNCIFAVWRRKYVRCILRDLLYEPWHSACEDWKDRTA